ncbi:MAG: toll/interleukin-1 receptor domain-containing protein, partial [Nocardioidaceae bacterium]
AARRSRRSPAATAAFDAFISYSHAADSELAKALQSGLHRFAKPWYRLRALRVFRDEANLATDPHLWKSIREALLGARHLILLASPEAARSEWVARELETWTERHGSERLLLVLTGGELAWKADGEIDWTGTDALPPASERAFAGVRHFVGTRTPWGDHDPHEQGDLRLPAAPMCRHYT